MFHATTERAAQWVFGMTLASCLWGHTTNAQTSTDHVLGKVYVIRVSDHVDTEQAIEQLLPDVKEGMRKGDALTAYMVNNLFVAKQAQEAKWFIAYFDEQRQSEEDLVRDMYLLTWYFHGHNPEICPLEMLESPIGPLLPQHQGKVKD